MFNTRIDLNETTREKVIALLNARLAEIMDLATHTKNAHWNVKGPSFYALHKLFDDITADLRNHADEVAERAVALGGVARGTLSSVAERSPLPEYPADARTGLDHVAAVAGSIAFVAKSVRASIDLAEEHADAVTADLFTGVSAALDKWLWFVEAHTQEKA